MRLLLAFTLLLISTVTFALEIDEKLTLRLLDVSQSKKTVLVNRGIEDGLVVGDHAKFFKTTGVTARGVVIKVAPTRSIWSLYRIIEADTIIRNHVLSLKISAPVKVTNDPSRAIRQDEVISSSISVAEGADDLPHDLSKSEQDDLSSLSDDSESSSTPTGGIDKMSLWQVFGHINYNMMNSSITEGTAQATTATTTMLGGAGIEKYFSGAGSFMDRLSLFVFAEKTLSASHEVETFEPSSIMLYGGGLSIHIVNSPLSYGKLIPYFTMSGGIGVATTTYQNATAEGGINFWNLGGGLKYNLKNGFGLRGAALYSSRAETYNFEGGTVEQLTISHTGYGINLGVSYRF
ncbi:MAG: hypothetical protein KAG61_01360 [Bacteriovoracaceae bacterium]|nr:hypothetical protein [Bacteriovoracaceae bacterium]